MGIFQQPNVMDQMSGFSMSNNRIIIESYAKEVVPNLLLSGFIKL